MSDYAFLLVLLLIAAEFWQRRRQAELAERLITHYCQREQWQLISVARHEGELLPLLLRMLLHRASCFCFEYSEEGEERLQGELFLTGLQAPLFRTQSTRHSADHVIPCPQSRH